MKLLFLFMLIIFISNTVALYGISYGFIKPEFMVETISLHLVFSFLSGIYAFLAWMQVIEK